MALSHNGEETFFLNSGVQMRIQIWTTSEENWAMDIHTQDKSQYHPPTWGKGNNLGKYVLLS